MTHGTIKKEKDASVFEFPEIGHKMTLYVNIFHNVAVSHQYFYEHLAACYDILAARARDRVKKLEGKDDPDCKTCGHPRSHHGEEMPYECLGGGANSALLPGTLCSCGAYSYVEKEKT